MTEANQFYSSAGLNVETYDVRTEQELEGGRGDVEFYRRWAAHAGDPVLELGAGTGRVTWVLARSGATVVGLERSAAMLQRAEAKGADVAAAVRQRVRFVQGDMIDFELGAAFALVIIPYRSFQMITSPPEQRRSLRCIHRHLRAGGRLIVDLFDPLLEFCVPEASSPCLERTVRHPVSGNAVRVEVVRLQTDPVKQVLVERWRFREVNEAGDVLRQEEEALAMRWTYRQEMRYLLELTGFEIEHEFSDCRESPPAYGREMLYVARRA